MPLLSLQLSQRIDEKLKALNALRPLPISAVKKLQEQFKIEMTYNSNGIEGNSLTLRETFLVINEGVTVKGKPLKDHLEAKDHHEALEYLYDLIEKDKQHTVSEHLIRTLHQIITHDLDREWAGKYRNGNVIIGGASHTPPDAFDVPHQMRQLIQWSGNGNKKKIHPIELAALFHHKLVYIHPFFDGNGRTSRLAMNIMLMQKGYPLVIILKNDRKKYYDVLSKADNGNTEPLIRFIAQAVERSLDIYLKSLTPSTKNSARYMALRELSKGTPYDAKYLNLLARTGKLEAHKQGRNWVSTRESLERYIEARERKR